VIASGLALTIAAGLQFQTFQPSRLLAVYLIVTAILATLKLRIPSIAATVSGASLMTFAGMTELTFAENVLIGVIAGMAQCLLNTRRRPRPIQVVFSVAALVTAVTATYLAGRYVTGVGSAGQAVALVTGAVVYFILITVIVSGMLSIVEMKPLKEVWMKLYLWTFPYYLVNAFLGGMLARVAARNWHGLLFAPAICLIYVYAGMLANRGSKLVAAGGVGVSTS
jgi:hypothetical protein